MRILLDECVPARLKRAFPGHAVQTVTETEWRTSKDGPLLTFAQKRFDVFYNRRPQARNRERPHSIPPGVHHRAGSQQPPGRVRADL
ncbi:hypothetical protein SBA6_600015 [Candidatus Sulfopaludibacter sp. SbA6]|nr:hypothetical protein SBA6_600015 [Candidatus Sulfopaludibacter sp. SbA6]